jgi:hypothetical protein
MPEGWPGSEFIGFIAVPAILLGLLALKRSRWWQILAALLCAASILIAGYVQAMHDPTIARDTIAASHRAVDQLVTQRNAMDEVELRFSNSLKVANAIASKLEHATSAVIAIERDTVREEIERTERELIVAQYEALINETRREIAGLIFKLKQSIDLPVNPNPAVLKSLDSIGFEDAKQVLGFMEAAERELNKADVKRLGIAPDGAFLQAVDSQRQLVDEWQRTPSSHHDVYRARAERSVTAAVAWQKDLIDFQSNLTLVELQRRATAAKQRLELLVSRDGNGVN